MTSLLILFLGLAGHAEPSNDEILERLLSKPWNSPRSTREAPPKQRDVNRIAKGESRGWPNGPTLDDRERAALRALVNASQCEFTNDPWRNRIQPTKCPSAKQALLCRGPILCRAPGFTFKIGSHCFTTSERCPDAKTCALGAYVDRKVDETEDIPRYINFNRGGDAVEKD